MKKNQHVVPHGKGEWAIKGEGNEKYTHITNTQAKAIEIAKEISKNQQSEMFIHGKNGQIRERNTYGEDKFPPER